MGLASAGSMAQAQTDELTGTSQINTRIDNIQRDVATDMARGQDASRFGNPEFRPGLSGGASPGYSGQTGNSASQEFTAGALLRFAAGKFVQNIGLAVDYADDSVWQIASANEVVVALPPRSGVTWPDASTCFSAAMIASARASS